MNKLLILPLLLYAMASFADKIKDVGHAEQLIQYADSLTYLAKFDEAKQILREVESWAESHKQYDCLLHARNVLADISIDLYEYNESIYVLNKSSKLLKYQNISTLQKAEYFYLLCMQLSNNYRYDLAKKYALFSMKLFKSIPNISQAHIAKVYKELSYTNYWVWDSMYYYSKLAVKICPEETKFDKKIKGKAYSCHGYSIRLFKKEYQKSYNYYQIGKITKEKIFPLYHPELIDTYRYFVKHFTVIGDYKKALIYGNKLISATRKFTSENNYMVALALKSVAEVYYYAKDYKKSITYNKLAEKFVIESKLDPRQRINYSQLAISYNRTAKYDSAIKYFNILHQYYKEIDRLDRFAYGELAYSFEMLGGNENFNKLYLKSIIGYKKFHGNFHDQTAEIHRRYSHYFTRQNQIDSALHYIHYAIHYFHKEPIEIDKNYRINPQYFQVTHNTRYLESLQEKAMLLTRYYHEKTQNIKDLQAALSTYQLAITFSDSLRNIYQSEDSKLEISKLTADVYKGAVEDAVLLYELTGHEKYLRSAFEIAEKNKASVLYSSIQEAQARKFGKLPAHVAGQELKLREAIVRTTNQIKQLENIHFQSAKNHMLELNMQLYTLQEKYDMLLQELEKKYPAYSKAKRQVPVARVHNLQRYLEPHQKMLVYFQGKNRLYAFVVGKKLLNVHTLALPHNFEEHVSNLRQSLSSAAAVTQGSKNWNIFVSSARSLYQSVFHPLRPGLNRDDQLFIISDGAMALIPFEVLLASVPTQNFSYDKLDYLIYHHSISYANSASLWLKSMSEKRERATKELLAFAPNFSSKIKPKKKGQALHQEIERGNLIPLKWNLSELEVISKYFKTEQFTGKNATEEQFKQHAPDYRILHLATHAVVDMQKPAYSKMHFAKSYGKEDGALHNYEMYNLPLKAELAVLSACNTGAGRTIAGEGVMNLARGFTYAGCPSIIMSLWNANDRSSAELMMQFYKYLSTGMDKATALQKAKLAYLSRADAAHAHPYFWGQFVATGDMRPITKTVNFTHYIIGSIITMLVLIYFVRRFRLYHQFNRLTNVGRSIRAMHMI